MPKTWGQRIFLAFITCAILALWSTIAVHACHVRKFDSKCEAEGGSLVNLGGDYKCFSKTELNGLKQVIKYE